MPREDRRIVFDYAETYEAMCCTAGPAAFPSQNEV
jgi:hypothetical protein